MFDINKADKEGCTALIHAVINNREDTVKILLSAKDINVDEKTLSYTNWYYIGIQKLLYDYMERHKNI